MKKTKHFVLDANVLINAFLQSNYSVATQAYYRAKEKGQIVYSSDTLSEFIDVFVRPKFDRYLQLEKR
jgi:predicted nucleic acid-binding protein